MEIFLLLLIFLLYTLFVVFFFSKKNTHLFAVLLILLWLYDWIFISLSYYFSSSFVYGIKIYQEVFFVVLLLSRAHTIAHKKKIRIIPLFKYLGYCIIFPLFVLIITSLVAKEPIDLIINGFRFFYFPIIFVFLIYSSNLFSKVNFRLIRSILGVILLITVLFAAYQFYFFNGDLSTLWFYNNYKQSGEVNMIDQSWYNFIKGDKLRATSIFVTPIDLSVFSAFIASLFTSKLFKRFKSADFIFLSVALFGIYLSQTRMGWVIYFIDLILILLLRRQSFVKMKLWVFISIPILAISMTIVILSKGVINDLSALGRLKQYLDFSNDFMLFGAGIGDYKAVFTYDSFFLSTFRMMGVFSILFYLFYFKVFKSIVGLLKNKNVKHWTYEEIFVIINLCSFIYLFAFHHVAGSLVQTYLILFVFYVLAKLETDIYRTE